jgi:hypothetical protein
LGNDSTSCVTNLTFLQVNYTIDPYLLGDGADGILGLSPVLPGMPSFVMSLYQQGRIPNAQVTFEPKSGAPGASAYVTFGGGPAANAVSGVS